MARLRCDRCRDGYRYSVESDGVHRWVCPRCVGAGWVEVAEYPATEAEARDAIRRVERETDATVAALWRSAARGEA